MIWNKKILELVSFCSFGICLTFKLAVCLEIYSMRISQSKQAVFKTLFSATCVWRTIFPFLFFPNLIPRWGKKVLSCAVLRSQMYKILYYRVFSSSLFTVNNEI